MSLGNNFGFKFNDEISLNELFNYSYGSFIVEVSEEVEDLKYLGEITEEKKFNYNNESLKLEDLLKLYEDKLEDIYSCNIIHGKNETKNIEYKATD